MVTSIISSFEKIHEITIKIDIADQNYNTFFIKLVNLKKKDKLICTFSVLYRFQTNQNIIVLLLNKTLRKICY